METYVNRFEHALLALDRMIARGILKYPAINLAPIDRVDRLVVPNFGQIGTKWEQGEVALSQVYIGEKALRRTGGPDPSAGRSGTQGPASTGGTRARHGVL